MEPIFVGVDPGQAGGLVAIEQSLMVTQMPKTERDIWDWFQKVEEKRYPGQKMVALIEKVHSMPGNGVASMFKFGKGYGGLRMALIAAGIPFEEVNPRQWQKALGVAPRGKTESKTEFKNRLKALAQQLHPNVKVTLATADALLIATYCQRKHGGR